MRTLVVAVCALLLSQAAAAQAPEPLFVPRARGPAATTNQPRTGRNAIVSRAPVSLRLDALFATRGVAQRIRLNADEHTWIARFERLDTDPAGFRSWVGFIEGVPHSHVVFTERDGVVSGLINAVGTTYQVLTEQPGSYLLEQVDTSQLGDERDPIPVTNSAGAPGAGVYAVDSASTFDVLMLYTPAARAQRGGTAAMEALVSQIISDTNTGFARSGITSRVRLVGSREVGLTESARMTTDLQTMRDSPQAHALRNSVGADLVQLLVHSPDLSACGAGYLLTTLGATDFPAYSVADISCAAQYTPTHEMGHNMGSHHAPEDGAAGALFSYSYGLKDAARGFRTVMAYACSSVPCARTLNFSNPAISHDGGATGTAAQNNAQSINEAALTVANFRHATVPPAMPTPPAAPTNLRSSVAGGTVTVAWDAVLSDVTTGPSAASAYVLQVGTLPRSANLFDASVGDTTAVSGVIAHGTYYWRVIATNTAGASAPSAEAQFTVGTPCLPPSAPQNLAFSVSGRTVTLNWSPPVSATAPVSYILEAGSASTQANLLVAAVGPSTNATTDAPAGTYFVRIRAANACGTSTPSNEQIILVP